MIDIRKNYAVLGRGDIEFLKPKNNKILAYTRSFENQKILCVVNLAKTSEFFELDLSEFKSDTFTEIFGKNIFPITNYQKCLFTMQPHSFFWFEILQN